MSAIKNVGVYCASSSLISDVYKKDAYELGRLLAEQGIGIVNGAGNMGLMRASADGCLDAGGRVTGVIPTFMVENDWHYPALTEIIQVPTMGERKDMIAHMTDAAIALAGGCGTLDELFELITNKQLGLYLKPIVILNTDGYYDHLIAQMQRAVDENFMRAAHARMWSVANTPAEAVEQVLSTPLWDANTQRFAKL